MRRKLTRLIVFLLPLILAAGVCFADGSPEKKSWVISGKSLGTEKNVTYNYHIAPEADPGLVLVALEGSRMDPRQEGGSVIWTDGMDRFNVIDFSIADELCSWQTKTWEKVNDSYSAAVLDTVREKFSGVNAVGIYAFSKGASGADGVCRRFREAGITVAFVWLNDPFSTHGLPYITGLIEDGEIMLYSRYSRDKRVNQLAKELYLAYAALPNVDIAYVATYHGGLVKYDTFAQELAGVMEKASFVP